jgi:hypothetical protein
MRQFGGAVVSHTPSFNNSGTYVSPGPSQALASALVDSAAVLELAAAELDAADDVVAEPDGATGATVPSSLVLGPQATNATPNADVATAKPVIIRTAM